jgi:hypothetical protein
MGFEPRRWLNLNGIVQEIELQFVPNTRAQLLFYLRNVEQRNFSCLHHIISGAPSQNHGSTPTQFPVPRYLPPISKSNLNL